MLLRHNYLSKDVLKGFDNYKYSCQDTSPLSNYLMHPFWNQTVKLCPLWIAPNLLTFIGFLCCIGHFLIPAFYDYNYEANSLNNDVCPIPNFAWFGVAFLLFMSHTLDGIDGKQARRTQTSSPLGELFDHGCDSRSTIFIAATFYSVFGNNSDGYSIDMFRMYLILWSVFFTFHMSHWEKYNTGIMYLPWSYDIAMLGGTILYTMTGIFGYEMWKVKLPGDYSAGPVLEVVLYFCCYGMSFPVAVKNIFDAYKHGTGKQKNFFEAIRPMVPFFLAFALFLTWAIYSPNNILHNDTRCFFYLSGTVYANLSCRLIVAQMTSSRCELLNNQLIPVSLVLAVTFLVLGLTLRWELILLYALTVLVTIIHLHYVVNVVIQMCDYLKIECFTIKSLGEHRHAKES